MWRPYFVFKSGAEKYGHDSETKKQAWEEVREIIHGGEVDWLPDLKTYGIEKVSANPQSSFRIQHVAQRPRGWRVRTKHTGRHELRIAFPPGPRRTGSGKLVEVLHPKGERNPECELAGKNPAELVIFGNPSGRKSNHKPGCGCAICKNARGEKHSPGCGCALCRKSRGANPRAHLTPAQDKVWVKAFTFYLEEGKTDAQADRLAWRDLIAEFPELKKFSGAHPNPAWMKIDGVVGKVVDTRGTTGSPEYLLETKHGKRVWVKPHHRPRTNPLAPSPNPPWTPAERKRWDKYERQREEIINRLHAQKGYPPPQDAAEEQHFRYLLSVTQKRMDRMAKKLMRNPDAGEEQKAVQLFQTFHGKDPRGIIEKHVSDAMRMEYTALGALEYLVVKNESGQQIKINFQGDGVILASSPQATQLYFIGGNQNLAPCLGKFTDDESKDLIDLGDALEVQYLARKAQGNFEPVKYYHQFGEEKRGSDLPRAIYDKLRKQVFLAGGEYSIEQPGIIN